MKRIVHVLIMTEIGNGADQNLVAALRQKGQPYSMRNGRLGFTASGERIGHENNVDCMLRLLREQLYLFPSNILSNFDASLDVTVSPTVLGRHISSTDNTERLFLGIFSPKSFLEAIRLNATAGAIALATIGELPILDTSESGPPNESANQAGWEATKKAFEVFRQDKELARDDSLKEPTFV